jgi:hypothetical protein
MMVTGVSVDLQQNSWIVPEIGSYIPMRWGAKYKSFRVNFFRFSVFMLAQGLHERVSLDIVDTLPRYYYRICHPKLSKRSSPVFR